MRLGAPSGASWALRGSSRQHSLRALPRGPGRPISGVLGTRESLLRAAAANGNSQGDVADLATATATASEADAADVLTAAAAAPRPAARAAQQQEAASTSGRGRAAATPLARAEAAAAGAARTALGMAAAAALPEPPLQVAAVGLLPEQDYGNLRGGQYPFQYDPVYGLPIVREVVRYGELLRDIRQGEVSQVLWFFDPARLDPFYVDGRCIVRYRDGRVKQGVVPPGDVRIPYAMDAHGVAGVKIPLEPRHVAEYAAFDDVVPQGPLGRALSWLTGKGQPAPVEGEGPAGRRGPRLAPSPEEAAMALGAEERGQLIDEQQDAVRATAAMLQRLPTDDYEAYEAAGKRFVADKGQKKSWSDKIIISQDTQARRARRAPLRTPCRAA
ncbi:MAG: hypothetical protein J3K34DRAFT_521271, partial [Monoraphidium minutum]